MSLAGIEKWRPENWDSHEELIAALTKDIYKTRCKTTYIWICGVLIFVSFVVIWVNS